MRPRHNCVPLLVGRNYIGTAGAVKRMPRGAVGFPEYASTQLLCRRGTGTRASP